MAEFWEAHSQDLPASWGKFGCIIVWGYLRGRTGNLLIRRKFIAIPEREVRNLFSSVLLQRAYHSIECGKDAAHGVHATPFSAGSSITRQWVAWSISRTASIKPFDLRLLIPNRGDSVRVLSLMKTFRSEQLNPSVRVAISWISASVRAEPASLRLSSDALAATSGIGTRMRRSNLELIRIVRKRHRRDTFVTLRNLIEGNGWAMPPIDNLLTYLVPLGYVLISKARGKSLVATYTVCSSTQARARLLPLSDWIRSLKSHYYSVCSRGDFLWTIKLLQKFILHSSCCFVFRFSSLSAQAIDLIEEKYATGWLCLCFFEHSHYFPK